MGWHHILSAENCKTKERPMRSRKKVFSRKKSQSIIILPKYEVIALIFNTLTKWDFSKNRGEKYHRSIINQGEVSSKSGLVLEKHAEMCLKYAWKKIKDPCSWGKRYNSRNISSNSSLDTDIRMLSSSTSLMRLTSLKSNLSNCLVFQFYKMESVYFSGL